MMMVSPKSVIFNYVESRLKIWSMTGLIVCSKQMISDKILAVTYQYHIPVILRKTSEANLTGDVSKVFSGTGKLRLAVLISD